jgi:hypothetical protein
MMQLSHPAAVDLYRISLGANGRLVASTAGRAKRWQRRASIGLAANLYHATLVVETDDDDRVLAAPTPVHSRRPAG